MLTLPERGVARFAEFGDLSGAFGVDGDWGRGNWRVEGEERFVEIIEGFELFI